MATMIASTPRLPNEGSTATMPMISAATRNSSSSNIPCPSARRFERPCMLGAAAVTNLYLGATRSASQLSRDLSGVPRKRS
jgi:hypothetical protein